MEQTNRQWVPGRTEGRTDRHRRRAGVTHLLHVSRGKTEPGREWMGQGREDGTNGQVVDGRQVNNKA